MVTGRLRSYKGYQTLASLLDLRIVKLMELSACCCVHACTHTHANTHNANNMYIYILAMVHIYMIVFGCIHFPRLLY